MNHRVDQKAFISKQNFFNLWGELNVLCYEADEGFPNVDDYELVKRNYSRSLTTAMPSFRISANARSSCMPSGLGHGSPLKCWRPMTEPKAYTFILKNFQPKDFQFGFHLAHFKTPTFRKNSIGLVAKASKARKKRGATRRSLLFEIILFYQAFRDQPKYLSSRPWNALP